MTDTDEIKAVTDISEHYCLSTKLQMIWVT